MTLDFSQHPCFNDQARERFGRVHLPVAPLCNVQCNFCDRQFNCVNESRPGVASAVLSPDQALAYLHEVVRRDPRIAVVGIAGPGDPFAKAEATLETLTLVRRDYPRMLLCVASNGLAVAPHAEALAKQHVSHVTLTINAVDTTIGSRVYAWIRDGRFAYRGEEAAGILLERQREAVRLLKSHGLVVKINSILIPGVNDHHIGIIAETVADWGADVLNCIPMYRVESTPFADLPEVSPETLAKAQAEAGAHLPLMRHCTRCRADAVGLLGESMSQELHACLGRAAAQPLQPADTRPYVAVATQEGLLVNLHLGEASELHVYRRAQGGAVLVETRKTPAAGGGSQRWDQLAAVLHDCRAVLVSSAGPYPHEVLRQQGIQVLMMEGLIEEGLDAVYESRDLRAPVRREHQCVPGLSCAGNGNGCG